MSLVTNVVVFPGNQGDERGRGEAEIFQLLVSQNEEWAYEQGLRHISGWEDSTWGGSKVPECDVFAAAFNYLHWDEFRSWLEAIPWNSRHHVRVLVQGQEDWNFAVWTFNHVGRLTCLLEAYRP